jgi:hypothetical protein
MAAAAGKTRRLLASLQPLTKVRKDGHSSGTRKRRRRRRMRVLLLLKTTTMTTALRMQLPRKQRLLLTRRAKRAQGVQAVARVRCATGHWHCC